MVEHFLGKKKAEGSIPSPGSPKKITRLRPRFARVSAGVKTRKFARAKALRSLTISNMAKKKKPIIRTWPLRGQNLEIANIYG